MSNPEKGMINRKLQKRLDGLQNVLNKKEKKIVKKIKSGTSFTKKQRIKIRKGVENELERMEKINSNFYKKNIPVIYKNGARKAVKYMKQVNYQNKLKLANEDNKYLTAFTNESKSYASEALTGIKRSTSRIVDGVTQTRTEAIIDDGIITPKTRQKISGEVSSALQNDLVALVDKSGRKWSYSAYSSMLTRTRLTQAANQGLTNQLLHHGFDLVQVSGHVGSCELCAPWQFKILSITGKTKRLKGFFSGRVYKVSDAEDGGLFHPNCRHRLLPFFPEFARVSRLWIFDEVTLAPMKFREATPQSIQVTDFTGTLSDKEKEIIAKTPSREWDVFLDAIEIIANRPASIENLAVLYKIKEVLPADVAAGQLDFVIRLMEKELGVQAVSQAKRYAGIG